MAVPSLKIKLNYLLVWLFQKNAQKYGIFPSHQTFCKKKTKIVRTLLHTAKAWRTFAPIYAYTEKQYIMKKSTLFLLALSAVMAFFTACDEKRFPSTPGNPNNADTTEVTPAVDIDTTQAIALAQAKQLVGQQVVVKGYVTSAYATSSKYEKKTQSAWLAENASDTKGILQAYYLEVTDSVSKGDYVVAQGTVDIYVKANSTDTTYEIKDGKMQILRRASDNTPVTPTDLTGDGTLENPFTVSDVIALNNSKSGNYYVKGFIVGCIKKDSKVMAGNVVITEGFDSETNIVLADAADETADGKMIPVQLPSGALRTGLNLVANPANHGQVVVLSGSLEAYFGAAGVKTPTYAKVGDNEIGNKPVQPTGEELLNEPLTTQASFDKFVCISMEGDQKWVLSDKYGATMSGYTDGASHANEDWLISPFFDAEGKSPVITFEHARGPKGSMSVPTANYTLWVSTDYAGEGSPAEAHWTQLEIPVHGTTAWGYVNSGEIAIPSFCCGKSTCIAWKYVCTDTESATWEIKNVVVK